MEGRAADREYGGKGWGEEGDTAAGVGRAYSTGAGCGIHIVPDASKEGSRTGRPRSPTERVGYTWAAWLQCAHRGNVPNVGWSLAERQRTTSARCGATWIRGCIARRNNHPASPLQDACRSGDSPRIQQAQHHNPAHLPHQKKSDEHSLIIKQRLQKIHRIRSRVVQVQHRAAVERLRVLWLRKSEHVGEDG